MFNLGGKTIDGQSYTTTWSLQTRGTAQSWSSLKRGDIIVMNLPNNEDQHVVLYLGDGYFVHDSPSSPTGGVGVNKLTDLNPSYGLTWQQLFDEGTTYIRRVA